MGGGGRGGEQEKEEKEKKEELFPFLASDEVIPNPGCSPHIHPRLNSAPPIPLLLHACP